MTLRLPSSLPFARNLEALLEAQPWKRQVLAVCLRSPSQWVAGKYQHPDDRSKAGVYAGDMVPYALAVR